MGRNEIRTWDQSSMSARMSAPIEPLRPWTDRLLSLSDRIQWPLSSGVSLRSGFPLGASNRLSDLQLIGYSDWRLRGCRTDPINYWFRPSFELKSAITDVPLG
jgi:hypothetical protein